MVPQIHDYFWPKKQQTIKLTASASASAESVDAAKLPGNDPPSIAQVPEPAFLPLAAFGLLALRRRRAR